VAEPTQGRRNLDVDRYQGCYAAMARIRAFEEAALQAQKEALVLGAIHPSIGQEAAAVGVCGNLRRDDVLLSNHRGHGHTMAKGADATAMMCELLGRAGGCCAGKGGSMHIADFEVGMLGANGVVGANIPIAAGAAHAIKLQGGDRVVACFFGDGALNRGPFLEGLNWASVFKLPVLFVCEDNGFAATTRTMTLTGGPGPAARADALGVPGVEVDGNDIVAVDEAAAAAVQVIRAGGGPRFILARTYRLKGHTAADPATYRSEAEVAEHWKDDPMARCAALLQQAGIAEATLDGLRQEAEAEMAAALDTARAAPWPDTALAYADVQDIGTPAPEAA
jgi:TPP-dependent pyruvate/acetoin dehydrogenase alpha subunit